jgi:hypothetical protein
MLGVVAGRADGAEGVGQLTRDDGIGRGHGGTGGAQGRQQGVLVHGRVGVDLHVFGAARLDIVHQGIAHAAQGGDVAFAVGEFDHAERSQRHLGLRQMVQQAGVEQMVVDGVQALGALRVAATHLVFATVWVGEISGSALAHGVFCVVFTVRCWYP